MTKETKDLILTTIVNIDPAGQHFLSFTDTDFEDDDKLAEFIDYLNKRKELFENNPIVQMFLPASYLEEHSNQIKELADYALKINADAKERNVVKETKTTNQIKELVDAYCVERGYDKYGQKSVDSIKNMFTQFAEWVLKQ